MAEQSKSRADQVFSYSRWWIISLCWLMLNISFLSQAYSVTSTQIYSPQFIYHYISPLIWAFFVHTPFHPFGFTVHLAEVSPLVVFAVRICEGQMPSDFANLTKLFFVLTCERCFRIWDSSFFSFSTSTTLFHCRSSGFWYCSWVVHCWSNTPLQNLSCLLHRLDFFPFHPWFPCSFIWCI